MITTDQAKILSKKYKTNETIIFREFLQLYFLNKLYSLAGSEKIYFKGGTALHLVFKAPRFSEDLDFTVDLPKKEFEQFIETLFVLVKSEVTVEFSEKKVIAGKSYLITAKFPDVSYKIFVKLDFSFREKVLDPQKSIIETEFPVLFRSYIHHLSAREIFAEKIRAILTRNKGRDIYDLWFLFNIGVDMDSELITSKLSYYSLGNDYKKKVIRKIKKYPIESFVLDLRPFVPINEREQLSGLFSFIKDYLIKKLSGPQKRN